MTTISHNSKRIWLFLAVLAIATIAVYLPGLNAPFIFDDRVITNSEALLRAPWSAGWNWVVNRRAVIFASLSLNYALGGLDVRGYHIFNLLVHLIAGLALFGILRRTLSLPSLENKYAKSADALAFAVALLWLVHPLQTQAVTYTIQRCESLMSMFYLLCLYALLRGSQSPRPWPWYLGGVAAGWLGMGCKEVMITAPAVLLLFDRVLLAPSWKTVFRRRWPFYLGFAPAALWLVGNTFGRVEANAGFSYQQVSPLEYLCSQPGVILHYLRLAFFPDRLCLDYRWPVAERWQEMVVPAVCIAAMLLVSLLALRYRSPLGFLGIAFFLVLSPTSSILPIADLAVEHRMYLPLAAVLTLGVFGVHATLSALVPRRRARRFLLVASLAIAAVMFMGRTAMRNTLYRSPMAMWANVLSIAPHNDRAHASYGQHLAYHKRLEAAVRHFRKAIELNPDDIETQLDLATALARLGKTNEAIEHYRHALAIYPKVHAAHYNLGILLNKKGDREGALAHFRAAVNLKPDRASYREMLKNAQQRDRDHPGAVRRASPTASLQTHHEKQRQALTRSAATPGESTARIPSPKRPGA